ncbi:MAG: GNAT family N-acetyltransferase [Alphaproteobacteria bacterium]
MSELGATVAFKGAFVPARTALSGHHVTLVPLDPRPHALPLFDAAHGEPVDPRLWSYMGYGPFADLAAFEAWLWQQAAALDPVFYSVVPTGAEPAGLASYLRLAPADGTIEIGHLVFTPRLQRTTAASEAIYLLLAYAFDRLGYRRVEWKCDALNGRSRRAAERFGFTFEGIFRQSKVVKGRNRDTAWFAMLDGEWPRHRAAFEAWLAPANLDAAGHQRRPLAALR